MLHPWVFIPLDEVICLRRVTAPDGIKFFNESKLGHHVFSVVDVGIFRSKCSNAVGVISM